MQKSIVVQNTLQDSQLAALSPAADLQGVSAYQEGPILFPLPDRQMPHSTEVASHDT